MSEIIDCLSDDCIILCLAVYTEKCDLHMYVCVVNNEWFYVYVLVFSFKSWGIFECNEMGEIMTDQTGTQPLHF